MFKCERCGYLAWDAGKSIDHLSRAGRKCRGPMKRLNVKPVPRPAKPNEPSSEKR